MKVFIEDPRTGETLKRCPKCKIYKKFGEYHQCKKSKKNPSGIQLYCKVCRSRSSRKYSSREDMFWKRFYGNTKRVGECLEWLGGYSHNGTLPIIGWKGEETVSLRRVVYRLACGDLPDDMFVITTCDNVRCVRQGHLKSITRVEFDVKRVNRTFEIAFESANDHPA